MSGKNRLRITPGDWRVMVPAHPNPPRVVVDARPGAPFVVEEIATITRVGVFLRAAHAEEPIDNATLIAAAPALYRAARRALRVLDLSDDPEAADVAGQIRASLPKVKRHR